MEKAEHKYEQLVQRELETQKRLEANRIAELRKTNEVSDSEKRAFYNKKFEGAHLSSNDIAEKRRLRVPDTLEKPEIEKRHIENYQEYQNHCLANKIERNAPVHKNVNGRDIVPGEIVSPDWNAKSEDFWEHHEHTRKEYLSYAENFSQIQEQLKQGKRIEEIKLDKELGISAKFWFNERPMKFDQYKDSLIVTESGFHRAELAKMYNLNDVPAEVKEAHIKR